MCRTEDLVTFGDTLIASIKEGHFIGLTNHVGRVKGFLLEKHVSVDPPSLHIDNGVIRRI